MPKFPIAHKNWACSKNSLKPSQLGSPTHQSLAAHDPVHSRSSFCGACTPCSSFFSPILGLFAYFWARFLPTWPISPVYSLIPLPDGPSRTCRLNSSPLYNQQLAYEACCSPKTYFSFPIDQNTHPNAFFHLFLRLISDGPHPNGSPTQHNSKNL